jgi:hypothetical protein
VRPAPDGRVGLQLPALLTDEDEPMRAAGSPTSLMLATIALGVIAASVLLWWRPWQASEVAGAGDAASPSTLATVIAPPQARVVPVAIVIPPSPPRAVDAGIAVESEAFRPVVDRVVCTVNDAGAPFCGTCRMHEDCAKDEACIIDRKTMLLACAKSDCKQDADCSGDEVCRAQIEDGSVKRCVAAGVHYEGESCREYASDPRKQCQEGLLCTDGFCAVPCDKANPASCRPGTTCEETRDGTACVRDACTKVGCPDGTVCLTLADYGKPRCFDATFGDNCLLKPCPKGEECVAQEGMSTEAVAFQCKRTCDVMKPGTCPKGFVCGRGESKDSGACYQKCDPPHGLMCNDAKHERCATIDETLTLLGCVVMPDAFDAGAAPGPR